MTGPPGPCGCGCALDETTSEGFDVVDFAADPLGRTLYPWQRWTLIHGLELLPDGRPRFKTVLLMVARQQGKTEVPVILSAYWQFVQAVPLILGTSTKIEYAKESWNKVVKLVERCAELDELRPTGRSGWKRLSNGEQESWTTEDARYKIAASNAEGGRSLTIHRLILDELRQHHDYSAWNASEPATSAVRDAQIWAMSNAGDDRSVVLNELHEECLTYIESGDGDERTGLFEYSAPEDADPLDPVALVMANPSVGHADSPTIGDLLAEARKAVKIGGEKLTGFKTEKMCIRVKMLDPAVDPAAWARCLDPGDLSSVRGRVALCIDVAPDMRHATLCAAARLDDGRVRIEAVKAWSGTGSTADARRELPGLVAKIKPQALGWFPNGPAAALAADLADRKQARGWPPPGVTVSEIRGDVSATCMGFAELVAAVPSALAHSGDELLNAHVSAAERLKRGDAWVFSRRGDAHIDAAYAAAGAVHLARTLPSVGKPRLIIAKEVD